MYHLRIAGEVSGRGTRQQVEEMFRSGEIGPFHQASTDGRSWFPVTDLISGQAPPVPGSERPGGERTSVERRPQVDAPQRPPAATPQSPVVREPTVQIPVAPFTPPSAAASPALPATQQPSVTPMRPAASPPPSLSSPPSSSPPSSSPPYSVGSPGPAPLAPSAPGGGPAVVAGQAGAVPWHLSIDARKYGPFAEEQVRMMIAENRVSRGDHVWRDGMHNWIPIESQFPQWFAKGGGARSRSGEPQSISILAIASLIFSLIWVFGVASLAGIVLGIVALIDIRSSEGARGGSIFALIGILLGIVGVLGLGAILLVPLLAG